MNTDVGPVELTVLLTGERVPRIQALSARPLPGGREGGNPQ